jgi:uncharacterized LabA/DUF88 family protein
MSGGRPLPSPHKFIGLVDGENLVFRYQAMLGSRKPNPNVTHIPDALIWHQHMGGAIGWSLLRVNYYTSATSTDDKIAELEDRISRIVLPKPSESAAQICPRVFKKEARSKKTKIVDISIAIDALRHSYHRDVDAVWLFSGDGDYLPLIKEIIRNGTQVWLGAFSDGLNPALPRAVDRFIDLDQWFFLSK